MTMYSHIESVNILTALLPAHGVHHAVLCPGSQNAPLVHNLVQCPSFTCHAITDERTAGFAALGISLQTDSPVAVCVTSGSALLNLLPAVAEAYYQGVPLVVISADRLPHQIDCLEGQTIPQNDALGRFVARAVCLPQVTDTASRRYCNRLVNEALLAARQPVHINVPLAATYLHCFDVANLPQEQFFQCPKPRFSCPALQESFKNARRRLIIVGHTRPATARAIAPMLEKLSRHCLILGECIGLPCLLPNFNEEEIDNIPKPDFILYVGGKIISKHLTSWLRAQEAEIWLANERGETATLASLYIGVAQAPAEEVLAELAEMVSPYRDAWQCVPRTAYLRGRQSSPSSLEEQFIQALEARITHQIVCYANSSVVRIGNRYATEHRQCNRGVNGIDGCLSTAAGMALANRHKTVFCIIGDLSFFYDHNALWIQHLGANLRILLFNNHGGGIFNRFEGLNDSAAKETFIQARHRATASGICQSYGVEYRAASKAEEIAPSLDFLFEGGDAPRLVEVIMDYTPHKSLRS